MCRSSEGIVQGNTGKQSAASASGPVGGRPRGPTASKRAAEEGRALRPAASGEHLSLGWCSTMEVWPFEGAGEEAGAGHLASQDHSQVILCGAQRRGSSDRRLSVLFRLF